MLISEADSRNTAHTGPRLTDLNNTSASLFTSVVTNHTPFSEGSRHPQGQQTPPKSHYIPPVQPCGPALRHSVADEHAQGEIAHGQAKLSRDLKTWAGARGMRSQSSIPERKILAAQIRVGLGVHVRLLCGSDRGRGERQAVPSGPLFGCRRATKELPIERSGPGIRRAFIAPAMVAAPGLREAAGPEG